MSLMTQLEFEIDFTESEKLLANYILNHGDEVIKMPIASLAKATYTSPATIIRLCKKIGAQGYGDFKIQYSAELQIEQGAKKHIDVNYPFSREEDTQTLMYHLLELYQETFTDTIKLMDCQLLEQCANLLYHAQHIFLFSMSNSTLAGLDFQHKMMRINRLVEMKTIDGEQPFLSYVCTKNDVALLLSYSGETSEIINIASTLKENKVPTIAVTSLGQNQLSNQCNYVINVCSREKIFNKIAPFSSKASIQFVLDLLFCIIFQKDYEKNCQTKLSYDKQKDLRHPASSPINED